MFQLSKTVTATEGVLNKHLLNEEEKSTQRKRTDGNKQSKEKSENMLVSLIIPINC